MKKRIFCFSIILCLLLSGCGGGAKKAYDRLLSGDLTVLSENDYEVPDFSGGGYEYIKLDADGDGDDELFVRKTDDPGGYNGAFDFQDGELLCLHNDKTNVKAYDYPLKNGKMVRQFDLNDASTYTVFEYIETAERGS